MKSSEYWIAMPVDFGSTHHLEGPYESIDRCREYIRRSSPGAYRILKTEVVLKTQVQLIEETE